MSKEKKEMKFVPKKHPGMHEIAPLFKKISETAPLQRRLVPSKLNFAAPLEVRWR